MDAQALKRDRRHYIRIVQNAISKLHSVKYDYNRARRPEDISYLQGELMRANYELDLLRPSKDDAEKRLAYEYLLKENDVRWCRIGRQYTD